MDSSQKEVKIYTDGACQGNPGPGGYGVVLLYGKYRKELAEGYRLTTNNRMELLACIKGLAALKMACKVILYSDSKYVVDALTKGWARKWKNQGWRRNKKEKALNPDLWEALLDLCDFHQINFQWVRGHSGNPENERCDQLAVAAAEASSLLVDQNYERENKI